MKKIFTLLLLVLFLFSQNIFANTEKVCDVCGCKLSGEIQNITLTYKIHTTCYKRIKTILKKIKQYINNKIQDAKQTVHKHFCVNTQQILAETIKAVAKQVQEDSHNEPGSSTISKYLDQYDNYIPHSLHNYINNLFYIHSRDIYLNYLIKAIVHYDNYQYSPKKTSPNNAFENKNTDTKHPNLQRIIYNIAYPEQT
jgi:hypothetical protein